MPYQPRVPLGALGGLIDSHDERARSFQANRYGIASLTTGASFTSAAGVYVATGWILTFSTGVTGNVVVFGQCSGAGGTSSNPPAVSVDGGPAVQLGGQTPAGPTTLLGGGTGVHLTPNAVHTIRLLVNPGGVSGTYTNPYIVAWPL